MSWKRWKVGLIVACVTGLLTGLATLEILDTITAKALLKILVFTIGLIAKDALLFLKDHPADQLDTDSKN